MNPECTLACTHRQAPCSKSTKPQQPRDNLEGTRKQRGAWHTAKPSKAFPLGACGARTRRRRNRPALTLFTQKSTLQERGKGLCRR